MTDLNCFVAPNTPKALPLHLVDIREAPRFLEENPVYFTEAPQDLKAGKVLFTYDKGDVLQAAGFVDLSTEGAFLRASAKITCAITNRIWRLASLPQGNFNLPLESLFAYGWAQETYRFTLFKKTSKKAGKRLATDFSNPLLKAAAAALYLGRDCINMPANHLYPETFAQKASEILAPFGPQITYIKGEGLQTAYPLVYAVGQGAAKEPYVVDVHWGNPAHPKLTLVGKGVCFDSGGLDLKDSSNMLLMKKDMGGAAMALVFGQLLMALQTPVCLRILLPLAENMPSGSAFHPLDILQSRKGLFVEIGNTDAEGRLLLADALCAGAEEKPDLIMDFATLTGAAKVALGAEISAMMTPSSAMGALLQDLSFQWGEPLWQLPLFAPYAKALRSDHADLCNITYSPYGGSIVAALFLQRFLPESFENWIHIDTMAWNPIAKAGKPKGGEIPHLLCLVDFINRYLLRL